MSDYRYSLAPNRKWPSTKSERAAEYKRRRAAYRGGEYEDGDFTRMFLFQGCNAKGEVIIKTRRISPMLSYLVNMDAACIAGEPTLEIRPGAFPQPDGTPGADELAALEEGRALMRRAGVNEQIATWSTAYASEGDLFFEVGTDDGGDWTFYKLEPETVTVYADKFGRTMDRATVEFEYTPDGADAPVKYERTVTRARVVVDANGRRTVPGTIETRDGGALAPTVTPNTLGVCTVVWVPFDPVPGSFGISKCAFTDVEDLVAKADSATTQMSAIGTRWADPTLVTKGFALADGSVRDEANGLGAESAAIGKTLAIAKDEGVEYLTVDLTNVESLVNATSTDLENARKGLPEYMFTDSSASSSGLAMSYQATALVAKLEPRRDRLYAALARMVGMCRAAAANRPWSDAEDIYVVKGPPILPVDREAQARLLLSLKEAGAITAVDLVAQLQALGFVGASHDPAEYAATLAAEMDALDTKAHSLATALTRQQTPAADPSADPTQTTEPATVAQQAAANPAAAVADTGLNGAQAAFMLDAVTQTQSGSIPKSAAIAAVQIALPTTDPAQIVAMFADVVEGSTAPAAINPAQAASAP